MVNWTEFEKLPGSVHWNFELLCRGLIWLNFGRFGNFASLANQPGVEFHLKLSKDCSLGEASKWFGWQCRWYDIPKGRALGKTRRTKIEAALDKTKEVLPDLTNWVLWTRHTLTKADQEWFYALKSGMKLDLWTYEHAETLLSGDAEILRRTFFGDLLLTPETLERIHQISVASIRRRWLPETHQVINVERVLRRMLGEASSWNELSAISGRICRALAEIDREPSLLDGPLSESASAFSETAQRLADTMQEVHRLVEDGDLAQLRKRLDSSPQSIEPSVAATPRLMRRARLACGLHATNVLADANDAIKLLAEVNRFLGTRLVGVLADAGGGKTQLAAQLTSQLIDRPAGVLLHGRELHSGRSMNDLVSGISIQGNPVQSMEALLAALDAAGQRAKRRLPLIIDGLNEAEDPRDWKRPLNELDVLLRGFANVLVVCTVRTGARRSVDRALGLRAREESPARKEFADQALPDSVERFEIPDFAEDTVEAIRKYFRYFRINPGDADVPLELLSHPLTLRIFCEVTNPKRKEIVGIEAMPGSLAGLFDRYLDLAIVRISELSPRDQRYYDHDIRGTLNVIGRALWDRSARELPENEIREMIGDEARPWNVSIIHMLEQEGVVLRIPGKAANQGSIIPVYEALGGHLVAESLLREHGRTGIQSLLSDQATLTALNGSVVECHPLAHDIFRALVGLIPRRLHGQQLWQMVDEPLRGTALSTAASLEGTYLDAATVEMIADLIRGGLPGWNRVLVRLYHTRSAIKHPLNAEFLDTVLRSMPVGERDCHWTEWVRENHKAIEKDLQNLEESWRKHQQARTASDRLRAMWITWLLTTTIRNLRDRVSRALYWFGRGDPATLFKLAEHASDVNDPYVFERMLAASYGVAMAAHCDVGQTTFRKTTLASHALQFFNLMFKDGAEARTTHILTREYGRRFIELALLLNRTLLSKEDFARVHPPYSNGGQIVWEEGDADSADVPGVESPFRMDFLNYMLGPLARERGNYDFNNADYRKIQSQVSWRVKQLGWTAEMFGQIDRGIESDRYRYGRSQEPYEKIDRYGKKYSWIAYFELIGWRLDRGLMEDKDDYGRTPSVDIDPSFPDPTPEFRIVHANLLGSPDLSLKQWIESGPIPRMKPYLRQQVIRNEHGPWVALDGFVVQHDESLGRRLFCFVRAFLVAQKEAGGFARSLARQSLAGRWLPEKPRVTYTFAGEVPWCSAYPMIDRVEMKFVVRERRMKVRRRVPFYSVDGIEFTLPMPYTWVGKSTESTDSENQVPRLTKEQLARVDRRYRLVEVEEVQKEYRSFRALIPVVDCEWEGRSVENESVHGIALSKRLALNARLDHLPQTRDLQTGKGDRVTFGTAFRTNDPDNYEQWFFIRESVLLSFLDKHDLSLVWAIWGERELSHNRLERTRSKGDLMGKLRADFQTVHQFKV